ncbi:MAG: NAD-dependent epimerase/dehydratase family protein [Succinivibrio sp.]|nr:NAD-dependent epimerase/dehydratase family protein [Succinivibrio sp.]
MDIDSKIFIAGHSGLVGSALIRLLRARGFTQVLTRTHDELELCDNAAVEDFFAQERPDAVIMAAAVNSSLAYNSTHATHAYSSNLLMGLNIISSACRHHTARLCYIGSATLYPANTLSPISETALGSGLLDAQHEMYALAKLCCARYLDACNREYGTGYFTVVPCNLYGLNDRYGPHARVIPALIEKFCSAKDQDAPFVSVWGSGKARREFLCSDDLAEAILHLMSIDLPSLPGSLINVGTGYDLSIRELALLIRKITGFSGEVVFDTTKPEGAHSRLLDISLLRNLGWQPRLSLEEGLQLTCSDYLKLDKTSAPNQNKSSGL